MMYLRILAKIQIYTKGQFIYSVIQPAYKRNIETLPHKKITGFYTRVALISRLLDIVCFLHISIGC